MAPADRVAPLLRPTTHERLNAHLSGCPPPPSRHLPPPPGLLASPVGLLSLHLPCCTLPNSVLSRHCPGLRAVLRCGSIPFAASPLSVSAPCLLCSASAEHDISIHTFMTRNWPALAQLASEELVSTSEVATAPSDISSCHALSTCSAPLSSCIVASTALQCWSVDGSGWVLCCMGVRTCRARGTRLQRGSLQTLSWMPSLGSGRCCTPHWSRNAARHPNATRTPLLHPLR